MENISNSKLIPMFVITEIEHDTKDVERVDAAEENDDIMEKTVKLNGKDKIFNFSLTAA